MLAVQINLFHPWILFRMLQLQHHQLLQTACPQTSQTAVTNGIPSSDSLGTCKASNSLLLSELQRENSFELAFGNSQLLQPHFFGVSVSPVSSAAHLLDTHLYISSNVSPVGTTFSQQQSFSAQSPSYDAVTLQHGDCEMEDLTSSQLGKFVLVKWKTWLLQLLLLLLWRASTTVPWCMWLRGWLMSCGRVTLRSNKFWSMWRGCLAQKAGNFIELKQAICMSFCFFYSCTEQIWIETDFFKRKNNGGEVGWGICGDREGRGLGRTLRYCTQVRPIQLCCYARLAAVGGDTAGRGFSKKGPEPPFFTIFIYGFVKMITSFKENKQKTSGMQHYAFIEDKNGSIAICWVFFSCPVNTHII